MAGPPALRVELLGGFRVLADGRDAPRPPNARQQQLVAFLVLHARNAPVPRQRVAGTLWPESSDAQALTNLRRELHHLREGWPRLESRIDGESRTLAWRPDARTVVDIVAFEEAVDRGLARRPRCAGRGGTFVQGDVLPDCTSEWIDADRERLRQRATSALRRLVALLEQEHAFGEAIEHAPATVPARSAGRRRLVRPHAVSRAAAASARRRCTSISSAPRC